ncbi:MAG: hypothetical protein ACTHQQ_12825 [Solirubrobacteraceae bacterium]
MPGNEDETARLLDSYLAREAERWLASARAPVAQQRRQGAA